jgi:excisionase family DNA binding protein
MENGMSPSEVAQKLGISLDAVYKLLYARKLAAIKRDGVWLVSPEAVEERLRRKNERA